MPVFRLGKELIFPSPELAEDGLLAVGGDLSVPRLLLAYRHGIFPWYSQGEPILWWSPDPRMVLLPEELHVSRRLQRSLKQGRFRVTCDTCFAEVIRACARTPRKHERGTWITAEMQQAYIRLHEAGYAHSFETWDGDTLAGGLYGVSLGACFFGESMFSQAPDASKTALAIARKHFVDWGIRLIDCQLPNPHLRRLGAREIPRAQFLHMIEQHLQQPTRPGPWTLSPDS